MAYSMKLPDGTLINDIPDELDPVAAKTKLIDSGLITSAGMYIPQNQDNPLVRGYKSVAASVGLGKDLAAENYDAATENLARQARYARENPGSAESIRLQEAWQKGEGITGGISEALKSVAKDTSKSGIAGLGRNVQAMGSGILAQIPNMVPPLAGMLGGAAAGSAVAPVLGTIGGGFAGAAAGNAIVGTSEAAMRQLEKAKINPEDSAAVRAFLQEHRGDILTETAVKGAVIGAVDTATGGTAHFLLTGPGKAAAARAMATMGVDVADKVAVQTALKSPQLQALVKADPIFAATNKTARNVGAAVLDPAGEFVGEYGGSLAATGEASAKDAFLEAVSSLGQSGAMYAGQKAYANAVSPLIESKNEGLPSTPPPPTAGPQGLTQEQIDAEIARLDATPAAAPAGPAATPAGPAATPAATPAGPAAAPADADITPPGANVAPTAVAAIGQPFVDSNRVMAIADVNGTKVPFYLSTGTGGKASVPTGKWYPFFGYGHDGWINKGTEADINNFYGSPELAAAAENLNNTLGDIRHRRDDFTLPFGWDGKASIPDWKRDNSVIVNPNEGMTPIGYSDKGDAANKQFWDNISNVLNKVKPPPSGPFTTAAQSDQYISQQKQRGTNMLALTYQYPDGTFGPVTSDSPLYQEALNARSTVIPPSGTSTSVSVPPVGTTATPPAAPSERTGVVRTAPTPPATTTGEAVAPGALALPADLAGAKPRYAFGPNNFLLNFESDIDKAAYIASQPKKSKRDADYVSWLARNANMTGDQITAHGLAVRASIKQQTRPLKGGLPAAPTPLTIPQYAAPVTTTAAAAPAPTIVPPPKRKKEAKAAKPVEKQRPSVARDALIAKVDAALANTPDFADYLKNPDQFKGKTRRGEDSVEGTPFITFTVGDKGKFTVRNSTKGLLEFKAKLNSAFTVPKGKLPASTGVAKGSTNPISAVSNMLEEGDLQAARDYMAATGIDENSLDDRTKKRIAQLESSPATYTRIDPAWDYSSYSGNRLASLTREGYVATVKGTTTDDSGAASIKITKDGKEVYKGSQIKFEYALETAQNFIERNTEKPPAMARAGKTAANLDTGQVTSIIDAIKKRWKNAPEIIVAENMDDPAIPQVVRDYEALQKAKGKPEGFIHRGKVYILADQMDTPATVVRTLFHESLGHFGLQGVFGKALSPILDQIVIARKAEVQAKATQYGLDMNDKAQARRAAEEVLAVMAQTNPELGFVKRAVSAIRSFLRRMGVNLDFTDNDIIRDFILPAREFVKTGKGAAVEGTAFSRTDNFKKWFGDSKVVDENGEPLVVYHGTPYDFVSGRSPATFNTKDFGALLGKGAYFTADPTDAEQYAGKAAYGGKPNIIPAYVSLKNPYITDSILEKLPKQNELSAKGYDGVLLKNKDGSVKWAVAFEPTQIKSATGNIGTYDPTNPDIRYSLRKAPEWVPQNIWDLHEKHRRADEESMGTAPSRVNDKDQAFSPGALKRNQVMSFRRLNAAVEKYVGNNEDDANALMVRMNEESGRREDEAPIRLSLRKAPDTPEFKRWFGNSKVVDENGEPLVVSHISKANPTIFDKKYKTELSAMGFHFGTKEQAQKRGTQYDFDSRSPTMGDYYLSIQNPLEVSHMASYAPDHLADKLMDMDLITEEKYASFRDKYRDEPDIGAALVKILQKAGYDGLVYSNEKEGKGNSYVPFEPTQIKSATGNIGTYDPTNPDIRYSRVTSVITDKLNETFNHPGKMSLWHKTVGSMYDLAQRNAPFKRVFSSTQNFINDVSYYSNEAANMAPRLLPRLETWKDLWKSPVSAQDNAAVSAPIFEGTLTWTRDEDGAAVRVEDQRKKYDSLDEEEKAQMLIDKGIVTREQLNRWKNSPLDIYSGAVANRFEANFLHPGVVFSDDELTSIFKLTPEQISLYREFRASADRSLDNMGRAEMLRLAGKDAPPADTIMETATLQEAAGNLHDYLLSMAQADDLREAALTKTASDVLVSAAKIEKLKAEGYAPLSRFGRYTVDVVVNGKREYFNLFESARASNQMAKKMRAEFGAANVSQGTMSQRQFEMFQGITPESLELFGNMLGLDSTGNQAQDEAFQTYIKLTKNNRSAMKRMIHRKGIEGYSEDAGRVLAAFIYSNARQTSAALHMGELGDALNAIPKDQGDIKDAAIELAKYVKQPQEEAQAMRGLLFAQYLGGSVASALVNFTQPFMVSMPYLSQYGGAGQIVRAMKDLSTGKTLEADLVAAMRDADEKGTLAPQGVHQLMAQARGSASLKAGDNTAAGNFLAAASNKFTKMALGWGKLFGLAEQINRRSTFIAAYRVAKEQSMPNPAEFATKAVDETQFISNKANKAKFGRGAVGGTLMTFKSYGINYLELLVRMATKGGPEGKRAALYMLAALMLGAGIEGLPFEEDAEDLIDFVAQRLGYNFSSKQSKQEFLEDVFGDTLTGFITKGITGLPGAPLDVSSRFSTSNMIPGTGLLLNKKDHTKDVLEILGPAGDLAQRVFQGADMALSGDIGKAALHVAPKAIGNAAKGLDMAGTDMYKDAKGYKIIDTTPTEAFFKTLGFQPASVLRMQEANYMGQRAKDFYNLHAQDIRARWANGIFERDSDQIQTAKDMLRTWNQNNPQQRITVDMADITRRVQNMRKTKSQRIIETAPKAMRAQMRRDAAAARD